MGSCDFLYVHCVYLAPGCACQSWQGSSPGALEVGLIAPAGGKPPLPKSKLAPFMPNHIETFDVRKGQYCLCLQRQLGVYLGWGGTGVKSSFRDICGKFSELAVEFVFYQLGKMPKMPLQSTSLPTIVNFLPAEERKPLFPLQKSKRAHII